jgi:hypothetical protein
VVAAAAFGALRWYYASLGLAQGTYTRAYALHPEAIGAALFRISPRLVRDFAFLLPLLTVAVASLVAGRPASPRPTLYAFVWMAGWLAVYVPWPATFEYYLLPFAFGAAALAGPPAPVPCHVEPAHRRHLLPERQGTGRPSDLLVRMAGSPGRAAGGRGCGDTT